MQFYTFAQAAQQREAEALIQEENLNHDAAGVISVRHSSVNMPLKTGRLNEALPKLSPLNPQYKTKKRRCFRRSQHSLISSKGWVEGSDVVQRLRPPDFCKRHEFHNTLRQQVPEIQLFAP
jgi:hypothetical protein